MCKASDLELDHDFSGGDYDYDFTLRGAQVLWVIRLMQKNIREKEKSLRKFGDEVHDSSIESLGKKKKTLAHFIRQLKK